MTLFAILSVSYIQHMHRKCLHIRKTIIYNQLNVFSQKRVKAIESAHTDDDTKWLMYWCVYATFGILEFFTDQLLFWIPFYQLSKVSYH